MDRVNSLVAAIFAVAMFATTGVACPPSSELDISDPHGFFDEVVGRYQSLIDYRDTVIVEQISSRDGSGYTRRHSRMNCVIQGDRLRVETPASQASGGATDVNPADSTARDENTTGGLDTMQLRYWLWLAPHLGLRFNENPLGQFRLGVEEGFTPTDLERVKIEEKDLVKVKLRSGDGESKNSRASFDLFVNPDSMLIERVEGKQQLPDGGDYRTTLSITPEVAESAEESDHPSAACNHHQDAPANDLPADPVFNAPPT